MVYSEEKTNDFIFIVIENQNRGVRELLPGNTPWRLNMRYKQPKKKILPPLPEEERIYLNVPYLARAFAKYCHCGFDSNKKLWFTGSKNANLQALVDLYGINSATSDKALQLMTAALAP